MSETQVTTEVQFESENDLDAFSQDFFGQKSKDTKPASLEAEQDETNEPKDGVTEAQVTEPEDDLNAEIPDEPVAPKKKTFQDRINELVKQREDEKRDGDARLEALKKEFEDKISALQPKQEQSKTNEPSPHDQNADGTDKYPLGEFDPTYIRDLTRFTLETERTQALIRDEEARKVNEQRQAEVTLKASWEEKLAPAREVYPDFQEKGQQLIDGFSSLDQGYAQYLTNVLMSMDKGPDVLYYLANNRDEAVKIVNSGAQKATIALGRIEAKFIEADVQKQAAKPRISKAPPPPTASARGSAAGHMGVEADTDDLDAFSADFFKKAKR